MNLFKNMYFCICSNFVHFFRKIFQHEAKRIASMTPPLAAPKGSTEKPAITPATFGSALLSASQSAQTVAQKIVKLTRTNSNTRPKLKLNIDRTNSGNSGSGSGDSGRGSSVKDDDGKGKGRSGKGKGRSGKNHSGTGHSGKDRSGKGRTSKTTTTKMSTPLSPDSAL